MVEMQNHGSIFYLFKIADLQPRIIMQQWSVFWSIPSSFCFTFHLFNITNCCSSAVINFNVKLKIYTFMEVLIFFWFCDFCLQYQYKKKKS